MTDGTSVKHSSHGHTKAGWYSVLVVFLGFVIGGFGVGADSVVLTVIGGVVILLGIVVALVLQRAGYGQFPPSQSRSVTAAQAYLGEQRRDDG